MALFGINAVSIIELPFTDAEPRLVLLGLIKVGNQGILPIGITINNHTITLKSFVRKEL
ncbi:hypothetical protein AND4_11494 [Vibrio sp. AND4]|nr:hypothetical protein AND4_11494 [Vibrio sp. AND4]